MPPITLLLMYFVVPLWLIAGVADWACHKLTKIESTSGTKESVLHLLMLAEVGIPLLLALFFEIDSLVIAVMLAGLVVHEATALWDVSFANGSPRKVSPFEQHVHSFLEVTPILAIVCVISLHWGQFLALFGVGLDAPRFELEWKKQPLPVGYLAAVLAGVAIAGLAPYGEELLRCMRGRRTLTRRTPQAASR